jgi:hypothetical protein
MNFRWGVWRAEPGVIGTFPNALSMADAFFTISFSDYDLPDPLSFLLR